MASQCSRVRAVAAGLSCGIGLAVPALAFAATLPFDGAHRAVVSSALPLAVGMLAGTGVTTPICLGDRAPCAAPCRGGGLLFGL